VLRAACCVLRAAIGPSAVIESGAFVGPLTMPHLSVNTLTCSRAFVWVCLLLAFDSFWLYWAEFRLIVIIFSFIG
jgi:hypothetical protein